MGYLKAEAEIRPKGNFFVVDTEYVGHNGSDLKSIISAIQTADYNALSNIPTINGVSLKGNLSAQNLGIANASEIIGENILKFPYYDSSDTEPVSGITRTINSDGTVAFNGTSTSYTTALYLAYQMPLKAGTYVLSGSVDVSGLMIRARINGKNYDLTNSGSMLITLDSDTSDVNIYPRCAKAGVVCDNVVFKPMLEVGNIPHAYQPYYLSRQALYDKLKELTSN